MAIEVNINEAPGAVAAVRSILCLVGTLWIGGLMRPLWAAAEDISTRMTFDVPADEAERSLKRFSSQSGLEVVYVSDAAANVRTNTVKGEYTPREAIDRMLAGTRLTAMQDKGRGALRIVSVSTSGGRREETDSSTITQSPAKKKRPNP